MCLEGQAGPFVGNLYQKANETEQRQAKGQSGYQDGGAIRPVGPFSSATRRNPDLSPRGTGRHFGLAVESIQMSSGATGSTLSPPPISAVQGVMGREIGNN